MMQWLSKLHVYQNYRMEASRYIWPIRIEIASYAVFCIRILSLFSVWACSLWLNAFLNDDYKIHYSNGSLVFSSLLHCGFEITHSHLGTHVPYHLSYSFGMSWVFPYQHFSIILISKIWRIWILMVSSVPLHPRNASIDLRTHRSRIVLHVPSS